MGGQPERGALLSLSTHTGMGGCCRKEPPEEAGKRVGTLNFGGSGFCGCSAPWTFHSGGCCQPSGPVGSSWDAARHGLETMFDEVNDIAEATPSCCGGPDL